MKNRARLKLSKIHIKQRRELHEHKQVCHVHDFFALFSVALFTWKVVLVAGREILDPLANFVRYFGCL